MTITRFPHGVSSFGMPILGSGGHMTTGNVFFVHYTNGSDGNEGTSPDVPFKTLDYAIGKCTASQGDTIFLMEGHAQTLTAQTSMDVVGVTVIGLGHGASRPTLTLNFQGVGVNISAADCKIYNVVFTLGTSSYGTATESDPIRVLKIRAPRTTIYGCQFDQNYTIRHLVEVAGATSGASSAYRDILFKDCIFSNTAKLPVAIAVPVDAIHINSGSVLIEGCRFYDMAACKVKKWATVVVAGAGLTPTVMQNVHIKDSVFVIRGIAFAARTAGTTPTQFLTASNVHCISCSANTAALSLMTTTYMYPNQVHCCDTADKRSRLIPAATNAS